MRMRWVGAVLGLVLAAPAGAATLALVGGTLVDGTLREPIRDSVILVDGERIVAVGTVDTLPVPAGVEVVSTEGMTVLPGPVFKQRMRWLAGSHWQLSDVKSA